MKRLSMLAVLVCSTAILAPPAAAEGAPASPDAKKAQTVVQRDLLQPLAAKEQNQSKFSRARLPAQTRRVRLLDEQPRKDAAGDLFVAFAVDARYGIVAADDEASWRQATITGCVYLDKGEAFVKIGDRYRPAAFLLGKNLKPVAEETCQAAPGEVATK